MPRGAAPGERRGGRKKGVPNKDKMATRESIEKLGCYPLHMIAEAALRYEKEGDFESMVHACKELAPYMYAKLKSIEHTGADGETLKPQPLVVKIEGI